MKQYRSIYRSHLATINRLAGEFPVEILVGQLAITTLLVCGTLFWLSAQFVYRASVAGELLDPYFRVVEVAVSSLLTISAEIKPLGGIDVQMLRELGELVQSTPRELVLVGIWLLCSALLAGRIATAIWRVAELLLHLRGFDWLERQMLLPMDADSTDSTFNAWSLSITNRPPFIGIKKRQGMDIAGFLSEYLPKLRQASWPRPRMTLRALVDSALTMAVIPTTSTLLTSATPLISMLATLVAMLCLPRIRRFAEDVASSYQLRFR